MANFSQDAPGDFGVPGVNIEPTLSSIYDPYSGIDLRAEVIPQNSCVRIEGMRYPNINDPFKINSHK